MEQNSNGIAENIIQTNSEWMLTFLEEVKQEVTQDRAADRQAIIDWHKAYGEVLNMRPEEGDHLIAIDNEPIKITIQSTEGESPFIFTKIFVPNTVGIEPNWYAVRDGDPDTGVRVIICEESRNEIFKRGGIQYDAQGNGTFYVDKLYVLRKTLSGKALIAKIIMFFHTQD